MVTTVAQLAQVADYVCIDKVFLTRHHVERGYGLEFTDALSPCQAIKKPRVQSQGRSKMLARDVTGNNA